MNLREGSSVRARLRYGDSDRQDAVSGSRFVNRRGAGFLTSLRNSPSLQTLIRKISRVFEGSQRVARMYARLRPNNNNQTLF
jgi:hypothetical protein